MRQSCTHLIIMDRQYAVPHVNLVVQKEKTGRAAVVDL
jgi:hypothetical protein